MDFAAKLKKRYQCLQMPGIFTKLLVLILCAIPCDTADTGEGTCNVFKVNKSNLNKRLTGHGILEPKVNGLHDCARHCFFYRICKSFDFHKNELFCKLNDVESMSVGDTDFEDKPGAIFSDITEWPSKIAGKCGERPCSENQRCIPDRDSFQCIYIICEKLPDIPKGGATLDITGKMSYLDTATVSCNAGYQTDKTSIKCQADTEWEPASCEKKECGSVYSVPNGAATLDNTDGMSYLDTATISCNTGYQTDKTSIKCQASGEWELSTCEKKVCGTLPPVPNGVSTLDDTDQMSYLDTATVSCDTGYQTDKSSIICLATKEWESSTCEKIGNSDCKDIVDRDPTASSGAHQISLWESAKNITVYCDMYTDGGGWTILQDRYSGKVDFYRTFVEYENGFGDINGEKWLGLKYLHEMVAQGPSELRIHVSSASGDEGYITFQNFSISAGPSYSLHISLGVGTIDDSTTDGMSYNNNAAFSTYDKDQDSYSGNCALDHKAAWWFTSCMYVNLNGQYCTPGTTMHECGSYGMIYPNFLGWESLLTSTMMFRRV